MASFHYHTPLFIVFLHMTLIAGCGNKVQPVSRDREGNGRNHPAKITGTRMVSPEEGQSCRLGEQIPVKLERITDSLPDIDSVEFRFNGQHQYTAYREPYEYNLSNRGNRVGKASLRLIVYYADGRKEYHNREVVCLSDIAPRQVEYTIVNVWPHDRGAYTQGLVYLDGFLYEGTGQWTESSLRKTEITSGEPVRMLNLPEDIFGEGITIMNDKIFQLTYKSQVGFVYDRESFKRIQKVYYENKEGWGLTNDDRNLIMSDGSNRIYFMDPEYFTEVSQIEVYDDGGPVNQLNELEYIEGKIFANIFGKEEIVIIDPGSGRVTGKINMKGILAEKDRHRRTDVFNGIAWNPEEKLLYVTGKYWPKLFEVSLLGDF